MSFASPVLLLALLLVPLFAGYLLAQRRRSPVRRALHERRPPGQSRPTNAGLAPPCSAALYVLALAALVIGLAWPSAMLAVLQGGRDDRPDDGCLGLDARVRPIAPSRLDSAKQAASALIDNCRPRSGSGSSRSARRRVCRLADDRSSGSARRTQCLSGGGRDSPWRCDRLSLGDERRMRSTPPRTRSPTRAQAPRARCRRRRPAPRPTRRRRPPRQNRRWSGPCSCPTVRTRTGKLEPAEAASPPRPRGCRSTRSRSAPRRVVSVTDEFGVPHSRGPAGHRHPRRDRRDHRRAVVRGAPADDLQQITGLRLTRGCPLRGPGDHPGGSLPLGSS